MTAPSRLLAVGVTPMETRHDVLMHIADRAEALGYDAFMLAEGWGHDAAALLGAIAARTHRIRIGTGVLNVWGRSPAGVAMLAATLDAVSNGRFVLGLGAGSPQLAEGLHDQPFHAPVARLEAVTRQVRALLAGGRTAPSRTQARPLRLGTEPRPDIPVHLAALGPVAVRLAGELADAWTPFLLPRSGLSAGVALLKEGAVRADRPVPLVSPGIPAAVAADPATARAVASTWVTTYLTGMGPVYPRTLRRLGFDAAVDAVIAANPTRGGTEIPPAAEVLLDELTLRGDARAARTALDRWYDAGAELPVVVLPPGRPVAELDHTLEALRPAGQRITRRSRSGSHAVADSRFTGSVRRAAAAR
jgi:alkanesulfonate monooxygenase SsuD/methylene tetrahydromethanopterin reductase-like flavin-dependent oxidoreductase (luciferase family)